MHLEIYSITKTTRHGSVLRILWNWTNEVSSVSFLVMARVCKVVAEQKTGDDVTSELEPCVSCIDSRA